MPEDSAHGGVPRRQPSEGESQFGGRVGLWLQAPPVDHQPVVRRLERRGAIARGLERGRDLRGRDERGVALRQPCDEPARVRRGSGRLRPRRRRGRRGRGLLVIATGDEDDDDHDDDGEEKCPAAEEA